MKSFLFYFYSVLLLGEALLCAGDMPSNDGWHGIKAIIAGMVLGLPWSQVVLFLSLLATPLMGKKPIP